MRGVFGTCIEFTRTAVGDLLDTSIASDAEPTVKPHHFAQAYEDVSACEPSQIVFTAKNWTVIDPANALKRMQDEFAHKRLRKRSKEQV